MVDARCCKDFAVWHSEHKDEIDSSAWREDGRGFGLIRRNPEKNFPTGLLHLPILCMCEATSHGHCRVCCVGMHHVDNDKTLELLCKTALSHVRAGADMVAPSDMMGLEGACYPQSTLDAEGYTHIPIMAYSAKYASAFYGPFHDAAGFPLG